METKKMVRFSVPKAEKKFKEKTDPNKFSRTLSQLRSYGIERGLPYIGVVSLHRKTFG